MNWLMSGLSLSVAMCRRIWVVCAATCVLLLLVKLICRWEGMIWPADGEEMSSLKWPINHMNVESTYLRNLQNEWKIS